MKFRSFILSAVAAVLAFAACEDEIQNLGTPDISISTNEMTFESAEDEQEMTVTATRDWKVETDADWVIVNPLNGQASTEPQTVTVSVLENTGMNREASLKFTIGMKSKYLTVSQAGPGGSVESLVVYANNFDKTLAEKSSDGWKTYLNDASYDGWRNETGSGIETVTYAAKSLTARTNSADGSGGKYSNYTALGASGKNYLWFGTAPTYFAVKNITLPEGKRDYTLSFGSERYEYKEGVTVDNTYNWNEFSVYVSADAQKWVKLSFDFAGGTLLNGKWDLASSTFTLPEGTTALNIYFTSSVGSAYAIDDVKLVQSDKAGTVIDFASGEEFEVGGDVAGGGGSTGEAPESKGKKTVEEFIATADTQNYYELTGKVSGFNPTYCSFDLTDATRKIYVYSVLDASKAEWTSKISNGGTITIYGKYLYYEQKSQHEVVNAHIVSFTAGTVETPTEITNVTVEEFLAKPVDDTWYRLSGTVSGSINTTYGNFDLVDETGTVFVYGLSNWSSYSSKFAVGDKVTIVGHRYIYTSDGSTKDEVKDAYVESWTAGEGNTGGGETPTPPAGDDDEVTGTVLTISRETMDVEWTTNGYGQQNISNLSTYLSWSVNGAGFIGAKMCLPPSNNSFASVAIQCQGNASDTAKQSRFGNTESLGKIKKITVVSHNENYTPNFNLAVGTEQVVGVAVPSSMIAASSMTTTKDGTTYTSVYVPTEDVGFFAIYKNTQGAFYFSEVIVEYEAE